MPTSPVEVPDLVAHLRLNAADEPDMLAAYIGAACELFLLHTGKVDFPDPCPSSISVAVLLMAAHLWTHRGDTGESFPPGWFAICAAHTDYGYVTAGTLPLEVA